MRTAACLKGALLACATLALAACQKGDDAATAEAPPRPTLPVSLNAAMIGMVDPAADYIFHMGNGATPKNDLDWARVRSAAYSTMIGGKVIQLEGTGNFDRSWVSNPRWQAMAEELTDIGQQTVALAEARSTDTAAWRTQADRLIQNCLGCHETFKPEIPSEGLMRRSSEPESRGVLFFE